MSSLSCQKVGQDRFEIDLNEDGKCHQYHPDRLEPSQKVLKNIEFVNNKSELLDNLYHHGDDSVPVPDPFADNDCRTGDIIVSIRNFNSTKNTFLHICIVQIQILL